jgi:hypothetical protein
MAHIHQSSLICLSPDSLRLSFSSLVSTVLVTANVVSAAVVASYRRIGVPKSIGVSSR